MIMKRIIFGLVATTIFLTGVFNPAKALTFALQKNSDIIGGVQTVHVMNGESLAEIGRKFDVGIYEMIEANPSVNPWQPKPGTEILVPTQYILPPGQRSGLIVNLAEMRVYYFHKDGHNVTTHPIGIGRKEWETPLGRGKIIEKTKNPSWRPPKSIKAWYKSRGKYLPEIVPPGPKNPLGKYAMRLSIPGYLIHGTNRPGGIGIRSSSGCIRMYPEDIESLYHMMSIGESVRIIHKPFKIGKHQGKVYIEAHEPLSDPYYTSESRASTLLEAIEESTMGSFIDKYLAERAMKNSRGYPTLIQ